MTVVSMTAETGLISTQSHHLVELSDSADNDCELTSLFSLSRSAVQASDLLEEQITPVNLFCAEGNLHSLFVRQ